MKYYLIILLVMATACLQAQSESELLNWFKDKSLSASVFSDELHPGYCTTDPVIIDNQGIIATDKCGAKTEIKWADLRSVSTNGHENLESTISNQIIYVYLVSGKTTSIQPVYLQIEVFLSKAKDYLAKLKQLAKLRGSKLIDDKIINQDAVQTLEWLRLRGTVDIDEDKNFVIDRSIGYTAESLQIYHVVKNNTGKTEERLKETILWKDMKYIWFLDDFVTVYSSKKDKRDSYYISIDFVRANDNTEAYLDALKHMAKLSGAKVFNANIDKLTEAELLEMLDFINTKVFWSRMRSNAESVRFTGAGIEVENVKYYDSNDKEIPLDKFTLQWQVVKSIDAWDDYEEKVPYRYVDLSDGSEKYIQFFTTSFDLGLTFYKTVWQLAVLKGAKLDDTGQ